MGKGSDENLNGRDVQGKAFRKGCGVPPMLSRHTTLRTVTLSTGWTLPNEPCPSEFTCGLRYSSMGH